MAELGTDIRYIKGVGEAKAKALSKLGIHTLRELVSYFPRAYDDRSVFKRVDELIVGENACVAAVVASTPRLSRVRKGLDITRFRAVDETGSISITFFNQSYIKDSFKVGETYVFYGRVGGKIGQPEFTNPVFEKEGANQTTGRIMPVYHLTAGISQNFIAKAVAQGLLECGDVLPDPLPVSVRSERKFAQARYAYNNIHFPKDFEALELSRRRFIFEELFVLSCAMALLKSRRVVKHGKALKKCDIDEFYASLPFELTGAQKRSIDEALGDMYKPVPMSRLVQGDVGSGKTVVAAACCFAAVRSGGQAAFMAPTEILAEQHFKTLTGLLEPFGMRITLLTGGLKAKEKREAYAAIESGETDIIVGTHALISGGVVYKDLTLVIADEQHRFGVQQRAALGQKGDSPHILVMSATPIPRTLALIIYGEMDVSVIDELPPGRQPIDTYAVGEDMRARIYAFIRKQVEAGRQVYVVCPMVEENEEYDENLKSVKEYAEKLQNAVFPDLKIALLHGRMKPKEKEAVMTAFSDGDIDVLVATTVIEVGVDVPNASLMVVENADRFGLSQLHQLRGRIGRGEHKSYCVLFEGSGGSVSRERLKVMCETNDGFKISEADLRLRGPGDFFGKRQHGLPELKVANFATDMTVLKDAKDAADEVIMRDPSLSSPDNAGLRSYIDAMIEKSADILN